MSLITDDPDRAPRDCAAVRRRRRRRLLIAGASAVALLLAMAIILWLTLRPSSPQFRLLSATASTNATGGMAGTVLLDAAIVAHNPNAHALALYGGLRARASYAGLQFAAAAPITSFQQAQGDVVFSASLSSTSSAAEETTAGGRSPALLTLRLEGRLRWKVVFWVSGSLTLAAECVAAAVSPSQIRAVIVQGCQCTTTIE